MFTTQAFSRVVGAIYDAALQPSSWPAAMRLLHEGLGFKLATLSLIDHRSGRDPLLAASGVEEPWLSRISDYQDDVVEMWGGVSALQSLPLDEPAVLTHVNPDAASETNRYYVEWGRPQGLIDVMALGLARDATGVGTLALGRHAARGPITEAEIGAARLFIPHLHRAAAISRILELQETTAATFQAVIDGLATPVLILREDLSIVHVNGRAEALLAAGGALRRRQGRLSLRDRGGEAQLARAVRNDTAPGAVGREAIALQTESGSRLLHVLRLEDRLGRATARGAAVFVTSASPQPGSTGESMAQVFRLTPQEARVLALIGAGRSPGEAAAALKVRLSTVRTHLLRIFAKTGVSRQAELVRLFAAFQPPI